MTRTRVLIALSLLETSYPRELSRLLGSSISAVLKALGGLELDGLVAGRSVGRMREVRLNPLYFAHRELAAYLARLADGDRELRERVRELRRRPRRSGKPL